MLSKLRKDQQGVVAIEMAFFLLAFSFMVIGVINFGLIVSASVQLSEALRTGEQFALFQPSNTSGITQTVQNATSLPSQNVSSTATTFCECNGLSASCQSSCNGTMATYVTVTAAYSVPLIISYPGLSNPYPLNKSVSVRVQ